MRREATEGEPNQSERNKEQQDFTPRPFMRGLLESKQTSKIAKRVSRGLKALRGVQGQSPWPSETPPWPSETPGFP